MYVYMYICIFYLFTYYRHRTNSMHTVKGKN